MSGPGMRRSLGMRLAHLLAAMLLLTTSGAALATQQISYRWRTPRVTVTWSEGNSTPFDPGILRQVGHWKRVAHSLWAEKPGVPPLEMTVSFLDEQMGSDGPIVRLRAGARTAMVTAPLTEARVQSALLGVRDGTGAMADGQLPTDDADGRVSSTGEWVAGVSWRGGGPEIWLVPPVPKRAFRIPFPASADVTEQLIHTPPRWAPQGRRLAWVQGGRLALFEAKSLKAQLVTPADRQVVDFNWSPYANLLLVRFDDDTFQLLDLRRSKALAMSDLLRDALPMGEFFWAPSGRRLLFRTQTQVVTANLSPPRAAVNALDRFLNRLVGEPEPPQPASGPNEERLAVLDLAGQRLDTYSIAGTVLEGSPLQSVVWAPSEELIYGVAGHPAGGPKHLLRIPLRRDVAPQVVLEATERLALIGRRDESGGPRYAFIRGDRLFSVGESGEAVSYPEKSVVTFKLAPGPAGGYLGVEGEEITEDEPTRTVLLEDLEHTGGTARRHYFQGGMVASVDLESPVIAAARAAVGPATVDFDLFPVPGKEVTVLTHSPDGGAAELRGISAGTDTGGRVQFESLSRRISEAKEVIEVSLKDEPFQLLDARSGLEAFALRYSTLSGRRMLLAGAAVAILIAAVYFSRRSRRRKT